MLRKILEQHYGMTLEDAAKDLHVSRATLKRICRENEIARWPHHKTRKVNVHVSQGVSFQGIEPYVVDQQCPAHSQEKGTNYLGHEISPAIGKPCDSVMTLKVTYRGDMIKFQLSLSSTRVELEGEVEKRLNISLERFSIKYEDEDDDWILITTDSDLRDGMYSLRLLGMTTMRLLPSVEDRLDEIEGLYEILERHGLLFAQIWIPFSPSASLKVLYCVDASINKHLSLMYHDFEYASGVCFIESGKALVGRAFASQEYPLVPSARKVRFTQSFAIFLQIPVDCNGEWVESNNRYIWRWKSKELTATIVMIVHRDIAYDDFANKIITCCKLNCELEDIVITYLHSCGEKKKTTPFKINDQLSLSTYLEDEPRGVLRIYTVERLVENHNLCDDQQVLNDECGRMNMNIPNEEREGQHILSPEVRNRLPIIGEVADRQNKQELDIALKIACVKKDFRLKKAEKAYNIDVFSDHFNRIRDLVPQAATHLERVGFHRWSSAFFPGNRYSIMMTNIAKSVNSMHFAEKFHERRMKFINAPTIFVPSIEKDIAKNINLGNKLLARLEEGPQKDIKELGNHFQRRKINVLYAKELTFLSPSPQLAQDTKTFLNIILSTMKELLPGFIVASGDELGQMMLVEVVRVSPSDELDSFEIGQRLPSNGENNGANALLVSSCSSHKCDSLNCERTVEVDLLLRHPIGEAVINRGNTSEDTSEMVQLDLHFEQPNLDINSAANAMTNNENIHSHKNNSTQRIEKYHGITRKILEQHFGMTLQDAAKDLLVSRATLNRICREYEITRWPHHKTRKVNVHVSHAISFQSAEPYVGDQQCPALSQEKGTEYLGNKNFPAIGKPCDSVMILKVTYRGDIIMFQLSLSSTRVELEGEVEKKLKISLERFEGCDAFTKIVGKDYYEITVCYHHCRRR
ncbi:hypothetical protein H5410_057640 [Solanum commersonii]|uniref:Transcription factor n=1 Tax=Solanum commersonii TaxID=4109 RepID=A0A9J5WPJ9_SOLCO|nr:hypothetical protein H5410_057640 [Solanum commersonii]